MSSILNKLFPSLQVRLLVAIASTFILLVSLTLTITYISMDQALDARLLVQLQNRFLTLEEEYSEKLHEEHSELRRERNAKRELKEKLSELEQVLHDRNEWVYLISPKNTPILANEHAPAYEELGISIQQNTGVFIFKSTEVFYAVFKLPDNKFIVLTSDLKEKNEYMSLYRNRFIIVSLVVIIISILLCYVIIKSSLRGFKNVRSAADSIAAGDYSHRVEVLPNSPREVAELTLSFNAMIERTQILLQEIKEVSNNVAHDLRTPLTRIRGKVETTLMANADLPEHKELSGVVIEECDKLMLLINNMLTLAEYESGIANKKEERIDLKKLLKNLCEVFESVSEDKNITVNLELSDKELLMIGDTEKIQRSLSNLMDNAIKYSDNNGLITISAKVEKGNIEIDFTDKGCGISDENKKRIFERFYRVESSRTTTGNGLGLNLAKAFIESHNGTLSVKSEIGKGSCFKACFIS
jgi:signal transduction histidine kinase